MSLSYEQKLLEYREWVIEHKKTPSKKLNIKFSDGGDMRSFGYNQRRYLKEFSERKDGTPIPEKLLKFQEMCEEVETILEGKVKFRRVDSLNSKIEQYITKTRELGRRPIESDECHFRDGHSMTSWYFSNNRLAKPENLSFLDHLEEDEIKKLHPFLKMQRQLYQEGYYKNQVWRIKPLTFEEKTRQYLAYFEEKHKNSTNLDAFFSDGVKKDDWYHNQSNLLKLERKQEKTLTDERKKEVELFARMENEMLNISQNNRIRCPRMTKGEKEDYIIRLFQGEIDPSLNKETIDFNKNTYYFPDGVNMNRWIQKYPLSIEMDLDKTSLSLEERVLEYQRLASQVGRKLKFREPYRFTDQVLASSWLFREERRVKEERKQEKVISNLRMSELYTLALLDDFLFQLERSSLTLLPSTNCDNLKENVKKK